MALYYYQAYAKDGKKISGHLDAPTMANVKEQLSAQGLFPIVIKPAQEQARQNILKQFFTPGISAKQKILFTKQLAVLLKSGIPVLQAFELLIEQLEGRMRSILVSIKDDLKEGQSLADAFKKYPKIFETIYIQLVRAGEASGRLETILERLTHYLERRQAVRKKISGALQYPMMQLVVAVGVVGLLITYVVPQMAGTFATKGKALPGPTQFLLNVSDFITGHYIILLGGIIAIIVSYRYWKATPSGARQLDQIKLRLPLIKYLAKTSAVVQFTYALGMLIEGGVNLAEALDIVSNIVDNRVLKDALDQAREKIIKQGKIAQYLKQTGVFPPIAIYLIKTGEETGQLDTMLLTVAENYEEELSELADRLTAALGPIMLVAMAVIVGFIVLAIALPLQQMNDLAGTL